MKLPALPENTLTLARLLVMIAAIFLNGQSIHIEASAAGFHLLVSL